MAKVVMPYYGLSPLSRVKFYFSSLILQFLLDIINELTNICLFTKIITNFLVLIICILHINLFVTLRVYLVTKNSALPLG